MGWETFRQNFLQKTEDRERDEECSAEKFISEEAFVEQLHRPLTLEVSDEGARQSRLIEYHDIKPERLGLGECVIFIGGFGTNAATYTEQLHALALRGKRVVFCSPMRGIPPENALKTFASDMGLPPLLAHKASEVVALMRHLGIEHADIIGHSLGGAVGTLVAAFQPESVDQLVLDTPLGLTGKTSIISFAARAIAEIRAEHKFAEKKRAEGDDSYSASHGHNARGGAFTRDVLWRIQEEIPAIENTSIVPLLEEIRSRERDAAKRIPEVVLVTAQNDQIFRAEEIEETLRSAPSGERLLDRWVMYADRDTAHGVLTHHDRETMADISQSREVSVLTDVLVEGDEEYRKAA